MKRIIFLLFLTLFIAMSVRSEEAVSPSANTTISSVYPNEFMESTRNIMDGKHWRLSAVFAPMTFEQERGSGGAAQPRWGFQAGGHVHYCFDAVPGLSLSSGLTLAGYFYNLNDGTWEVHSHHVALQIPIRVQYEYKFNDNWAVFGYAGPKFDVGLYLVTLVPSLMWDLVRRLIVNWEVMALIRKITIVQKILIMLNIDLISCSDLLVEFDSGTCMSLLVEILD